MSDDARIEVVLQRWRAGCAEGQHLSLQELCYDCPELESLVQARLDRLPGDGLTTRLEPPPASQGQTLSAPPLPGSGSATLPETADGDDLPLDLPGYEVLGELGRGGMGVVYKARHTALNRLVALKMMLPGASAAGRDLRRFHDEAAAIAALRHPNIVQVHEIGEHRGRPFFSLEYCSGGSLDRCLDGTPLPPRLAAEVVQALAGAVQAAHATGIVHRDLKPSNVLLQSPPTEAVATNGVDRLQPALLQVGDFGLAKWLDRDSGATRTGTVMGTASYMAPEQAAGRRDVGTAADVYSLGAILYELLTGRPPFVSNSVMTTLHQVLHDDVVPPRRLNPAAPADLETLALRCLEKDPQRRPPSAAYLADELGRFLAGRPLLSRPLGPLGRLARWGRRNPLLATAAALVAGSLLAVAAVSAAFALRERQHGVALTAALREARRRLAENHLDRAVAPSSRSEADERLLWLARGLDAAPEDAAELRHVLRLNLAARARQLHALRAPLAQPAGVRHLAFAPGGGQLLIADDEGRVSLWDSLTGEPLSPPRLPGGRVRAVGFTRELRPLAVVADDGQVRVVDARSGAGVAGPFEHDDAAVAALSADGRLLLTGGADQTARLWDVGTGKRLVAPRAHDSAVVALAFSADGKRLATATLDGTVQVRDTASGKPLGPALAHPKVVHAVAFFPDGTALLTGCGDNRARVWDISSGEHTGVPLLHRAGDGAIHAVAVTRDGRHLLTGGDDGAARVWDAETGRPVGQALSHADDVRALAVSDDGRLVATGGLDRMARVWGLAAPLERASLSHAGAVLAGAFSPDGRLIATSSVDRTARLWHAASGQPASPPLPHDGDVHTVAFSPDGTTLLTTSADGHGRRWSVVTGRQIGGLLTHGKSVNDGLFHPSGAQVMTAGDDSRVIVWQARTGEALLRLPHPDPVHALALDSAGVRLASAGADGKARLWDARRGVEQAALIHEGSVWHVAFSPDGQTLVTGSDDRRGRLWSVADPGRAALVLPHEHAVRTAAFSDDGRQVATGSHDHRARLWAVADGQPRTPALEHAGPVLHVAFAPGGVLLATGSADGTARLWETGHGRPVGPPLPHQDGVTNVVFAPAGRLLLTCGKDGKARLWPLPEAADLPADQVLPWTEWITGKKLDDGGALRLLDGPAWRERQQRFAGGQRP